MDKNKIKAYCINLKTETKRYWYAKKQLQNLKIPFEFIEAIDGKKLTDQEILKIGYDEKLAKRLRNIYHKRGLNRKEIACAYSHLKTYKKIQEDKTQIALVLEDDAIFSFDKEYLYTLLNELPSDWEICLLYHRGLCKRFSAHLCTFSSVPGGAVSYLITLRGARKLLELSKPLRLAADALIGRAIYTKFLNGYGAFSIKVKHKENFYKKLYHFFSDRFIWVRDLKYFIKFNPNIYFSDLY